MDRRLITVIMAAVAVALLITVIFYAIVGSRTPVQAENPTKDLVVATQDLTMGSVITPEDVRLMEFPENAYPANAFATIEDVIDRSVISPILANEPVAMGRVTEKGAGVGLAPLIPPGLRAVALAINQVSGVSGFINPGSHVDILLTGRPEGSEDQVTTTVMEDVEVLTAGHRLEMNANGQPENVPVLNMLLTPEQAELLTLATSEGRIQLILRNPNDEVNLPRRRAVARSRDLFAKAQTQQRPQPRPKTARKAPPPPPLMMPTKIEMIRGNRRTEETVN